MAELAEEAVIRRQPGELVAVVTRRSPDSRLVAFFVASTGNPLYQPSPPAGLAETHAVSFLPAKWPGPKDYFLFARGREPEVWPEQGEDSCHG